MNCAFASARLELRCRAIRWRGHFFPERQEGRSHMQEFYAEYHVVGGTAVFQELVQPMTCFPFQAFKYDVYSLISGSHWFHRFVSLSRCQFCTIFRGL